jgi:hypothetical protein
MRVLIINILQRSVMEALRMLQREYNLKLSWLVVLVLAQIVMVVRSIPLT